MYVVCLCWLTQNAIDDGTKDGSGTNKNVSHVARDIQKLMPVAYNQDLVGGGGIDEMKGVKVGEEDEGVGGRRGESL